MDALPAEPRVPWAFRILVAALWLSWAPQLLWLLERAARFLEEPGYFVRSGLFVLFIVVLRGWLNWQFCRRRRWARLSLLWLHVLFACLVVCVTRYLVFYPFGTVQELIVLICLGLFVYLLARKDVALWCRAEVPSNKSVSSEQHSPGTTH